MFQLSKSIYFLGQICSELFLFKSGKLFWDTLFIYLVWEIQGGGDFTHIFPIYLHLASNRQACNRVSRNLQNLEMSENFDVRRKSQGILKDKKSQGILLPEFIFSQSENLISGEHTPRPTLTGLDTHIRI